MYEWTPLLGIAELLKTQEDLMMNQIKEWGQIERGIRDDTDI